MSNFNYCPLTWHFCGEKNTKKIEKIQERALRFIYRDYDSSYESLLLKSGSTKIFYGRQFYQYLRLETLIHKYRLANHLF